MFRPFRSERQIWGEFKHGFFRHPFRAISDLSRFFSDLRRYNKLNRRDAFKARWRDIYPCWRDRRSTAADLSYYFWQDLWAARKIFAARPSRHFDVGSRIDGFIAHVLSFMPVTLIDIRPLPWMIDGLDFIQADATDLDGINDRSVESLSSLCAIEHFGLGRYGDPVDPEACFKAMKALQRVLGEGALYVAVPVGADGVSFNAHRTFSVETVLGTFDELDLADLALIDARVPEKPVYREHVHPTDLDLGPDWAGAAIGLFEFRRDRRGIP